MSVELQLGTQRRVLWWCLPLKEIPPEWRDGHDSAYEGRCGDAFFSGLVYGIDYPIGECKWLLFLRLSSSNRGAASPNGLKVSSPAFKWTGCICCGPGWESWQSTYFLTSLFNRIPCQLGRRRGLVYSCFRGFPQQMKFVALQAYMILWKRIWRTGSCLFIIL